MKNMQVLPGIKYEASAGSVGDAVRKMLEIANQEHSFVYETINETPVINVIPLLNDF